MLIPNTQSVVYNKSQVEYLIQKSKSLPVQILPIGAITKNAEGKNLMVLRTRWGWSVAYVVILIPDFIPKLTWL